MRKLLPIVLFLLPTLALAQAPPAAATLTPADQGWVERIQDQLQAITTLKGRFAQTAPDNARTTGVVWLDRPGRMRFAYDPPSPLLLVAGDGKLVFTDSALKQTTEIPLDRTPLGLLLRPDLTLSGDVTVTGFSHPAGMLLLSVVRSATPSAGSLTIVLGDDPVRLQGWRVVDAQGRETRVSLSDLVAGQPMPASLFDTQAAATP